MQQIFEGYLDILYIYLTHVFSGGRGGRGDAARRPSTQMAAMAACAWLVAGGWWLVGWVRER